MKKKESKRDEGIIEFLGKKYKLPEFKEDEIFLESFTKMNTRNYENDLEKLPGLLNTFGVLVAKALRKKMNAEMNYKIWRAEKNKELRGNFDRKKIKYTEAKIENDIYSDIEYSAKKNIINKAEENYEILKSVYWAVQRKGDVLLEISRQRSNLKKLDNARLNKD